jgi:hypothetical protein
MNTDRWPHTSAAVWRVRLHWHNSVWRHAINQATGIVVHNEFWPAGARGGNLLTHGRRLQNRRVFEFTIKIFFVFSILYFFLYFRFCIFFCIFDFVFFFIFIFFYECWVSVANPNPSHNLTNFFVFSILYFFFVFSILYFFFFFFLSKAIEKETEKKQSSYLLTYYGWARISCVND